MNYPIFYFFVSACQAAMYLDMNMYLMINNLINTITASNYKIIFVN